MKAYAIVAAAGAGRRMGRSERKQFLTLAGRPVFVHTLQRLASWSGFSGVVIVAPAEDVERVRGMVEGAGIPGVAAVTAGGAERQDSVRLGLEALRRHLSPPDDSVVFVHDGARPFPPVSRFGALRDAAVPDGALLAVPCRDTVKRERGGAVESTVSRDKVWLAQTPQAFPLPLLLEAVDLAAREGRTGTDEAGLVEALGRHPRLLEGSPYNLKITWPEDLELAEALLLRDRGDPEDLRLAVGHGYDVHRLVEGRRLVLGGVELEHSVGLLGHSDADVLAHAVADACLGAAGLGDIGRWYPDTEERWKGASSIDLLAGIREGLDQRGFRVVRVDATVLAQRPRLSPHVAAMETLLGGALGLGEGGVTVKATTTEGLGFEGREEGISAHAVALVRRQA